MKQKPLSEKSIEDLFGKKDDLFKPSKQVNKSTKGKYKRATFHLLLSQIKDIKAIAFHNDKDISEVAREAFAEYISRNKK
jgi:uncharacterized protein (UPF0305 family)